MCARHLALGKTSVASVQLGRLGIFVAAEVGFGLDLGVHDEGVDPRIQLSVSNWHKWRRSLEGGPY